MDDDILARVVEVEREVQQRLEIEEKMSREWLENVRKEAEERVRAEEQALKKALADHIEKEKRRAEASSSDIISRARKEGERLRGLDDAFLTKIILQHIPGILPGSYHDR